MVSGNAGAPSALPDHQAFPCCFDNLDGNQVQIIYIEDPLDLGEQAGKQPKVATGDSNKAGYHFRGKWLHSPYQRVQQKARESCSIGRNLLHVV